MFFLNGIDTVSEIKTVLKQFELRNSSRIVLNLIYIKITTSRISYYINSNTYRLLIRITLETKKPSRYY